VWLVGSGGFAAVGDWVGAGRDAIGLAITTVDERLASTDWAPGAVTVARDIASLATIAGSSTRVATGDTVELDGPIIGSDVEGRSPVSAVAATRTMATIVAATTGRIARVVGPDWASIAMKAWELG
jgi:hypothetical protein